MKGLAPIAMLTWLGFAPYAMAMEPAPQEHLQESETWMQIQSSNQAASKIPQNATPLERDLAMRRWLETYKHPVPEFYEQDKGGKPRK